jgi:PST family polysaccharide transporter
VSNYRSLFKSTALLGGSQVILTVLGLVRNKALAVLLGPSGVGLAGLYTSITSMAATVTGLGIGSSGVRQIAEANTASDKDRVARVAAVIVRVVFLTNLIAALVVCVWSGPISRATFGTSKYAAGVALMSLVLIFSGISAGQLAILQGLQKMKELVHCQILGAVFGSLVSVAIVFYFRDAGVAWFLVANAAFAIFTSWWFVRRVQKVSLGVSLADTLAELKKLVGFGLALMASSLLSGVVAYFSRIIVIHKLGLQATGQFQAAYTLSSYYVGFILSAMGTGLLPKLTGLCQDDTQANRLLNDQTEIGLLLAAPGITATLVLAPWVLRLFYTGSFVAAAGIVQWQVIGVFFRMMSWPLWHLQIAKGMSRLFILTECVAAVLQILLNWVCIERWGLDGAGMAFTLFYIAHVIGMYFLCRSLSGFAWSRRVLFISLPGALLLCLSFASVKLLPVAWGVGLGLGSCALVCAGSFHGLQKVLGFNLKEMILGRLNPKSA